MFFFFLNLISTSLLSHAVFLPLLLVILCWGMESCFAFRKVSLKSFQFCSVPMSIRTDSQRIWSNNSLNNKKLIISKSWVWHRLHRHSFNGSVLLIPRSHSPTRKIKENTTCTPDPFNIFPRDVKSSSIFFNFLVTTSSNPVWKMRRG